MQAYAERYAEVKAQAAQMLVCQYMQDTLQLALHQTEGWGYDRIVRLCEAWQHIPATRQRMSCRSTWTK